MKLHLPVLLRKALLACFVFSFTCTVSSAADLTLGSEVSLTIDYADAGTIPDLENGVLQLSGDTILLLSNCGEEDGQTYTLATGVSSLVDAEGNPLTLMDENNAIASYFDTTQPGTGFWAGATLVLNNGTLQLVRHNETVKAAQVITTRQTGTLVYNDYEGISFKDVAYSTTSSLAWGGAIRGYNSTITLSNNGSVSFSGNSASSEDSSASSGAIYGESGITLSNNGSVNFSGNSATSSNDDVKGGAIYGESDITLSNNGSVSFRGNKAIGSSARGGAIYGYSSSTIELSNNGSVSFSGNSAIGSYAWGGAAYGGAIYAYEEITLNDNGSVSFSGNSASGSSYAYGGAIYAYEEITLNDNGSVSFSGNSASGSYAWGGAIYGATYITLSNNGSVSFSGNKASGCGGAIRRSKLGDNSGGITLSNNGSVEFSGNSATGSSSSSACGGAIDGNGDITLSNNGSVSFSGNEVTSSSSSADGGAIYVYGSSITLNDNGSVSFSGNSATSSSSYARGGAIYGYSRSTIELSNNGSVSFIGNSATATSSSSYAHGGAIYKQLGIFTIQNNDSVVFEKNYTLEGETLRLQSIYAFDLGGEGEELLVNFSAPKDGKIEFRDSIHIDVDSNSDSAFHLNNWYENDEGDKVAQTGDIIFTGADATAENLKAILAANGINREATADEIRLSKTSVVRGTMQLHDGRLIVRDGAIIEAGGITVHGSASGESTPTLWLDNGALSSYSNSSTRKNAVSISDGSALRLSGQNTARYSTLTLSGGSTLIIDVAAAHAATAALTLDSGTLTLDGAITLQLNAVDGPDPDGRYMLLSGVSEPTDWAGNITVSGGVWTIDDLSWVNNTLYLNFPTLTEATWNNQSGDRLWNVNSSVNWEQHDIDYAYKDGIGVIFGDEGAGTVTLVGSLTPASVLVNSKENYSFEGSGSLSGGMTLTKQGDGTLSISTANSYTGGTKIESGTVVVKNAAALGTGTVTLAGGTLEIAATDLANTIANTGAGTLKVADGITHKLTSIIANSGELTFSGDFQASGLGALSIREAATYENAAGEIDSTGGFSKSAIQGILLTSGSGTTVNSMATIWHGSDKLTLGTDGWATMGGEVSYGGYYIGTDHEVALDAIINAAAEKGTSKTDITLSGGKLTANTPLTGTLSISGTSELHGVNFNLGNTALQNNGEKLTLSGSFDASGLQYNTQASDERIALDGSIVASDKSGFAKEVEYWVQVVNGGITINSNASISHSSHQGKNALELGADGIARADGDGNFTTFYLEGTDSLAVGNMASVATTRGGTLSQVVMDSGTLEVDQSIAVDADGGNIIITKAATLSGAIDDTAVSTAAGDYTGEISATMGGSSSLEIGGGNITVSGDNSYTGGTVIDGGSLTITQANALGTGDIETKGESSLTVDGVTLVLGDSIANTGTLTLSGSFDASGLTLNRTEEGRLALDGTEVSLAESGFARGVEYSVQIVEGGTTVNAGAGISHKDYLSRNALVLGEDGVARAGGAVDYTHYFLTGGDSAAVSEIADVATQHQETLTGVSMDSGELEVDQSIAVNATGGSIIITKAATLSGTVENTAVSTAAGDYASEISALLKGDSTLEVNGGSITVSGANSYSGGTVVNGGSLLTGSNNAFGAGDVTVNGATLDLNSFTIVNKLTLNGNSALGHADGASHIVLGSGADVDFRDGFTLGQNKVLEVSGGGATYTGALTLGGGTIELDGMLTVQGDVTFEAGTQTTIDISGWSGADDGEVLATLGSTNSGYTEERLKLSGIAGEWELDFDAATGELTLVAVKAEPLPEPEFAPNLDRNQQVVYDTIKDIMDEGNPGGALGELGKEIVNSRDEAALKRALDELSGREYATLLSGQQAAASGHMRRLRGEMGSGHLLAGTKTRAYIEAYNHRSEVDGDSGGRGYELNESGGQFALEFLGKESVSGGFAVAAGRSRLQPDGGMTQKSDNTYVDAFLLHRDGAYTGKFSLGVGVHKYDLDRRVAGNAVSADASGSSVNFMHESSYSVTLDESNSVQVFGAVESSFNKLGSFHEKGADTASLQVESQDAWVTTLSVGARYLHSFAALDSAPAATLSLQGGLEFDFGDTDGEVEMNFAGARDYRFRQSGAERDTFGYNLGVSLHLPVSDKAAIYANGDAVLRGDSYEVNANVGLQMAF